ncbi:MAG TPA: hypothetical protein VFG43_00650, partial [Geminicoccaceae bacterium]|nr:hypothetical protein [Geminicoccaceae bacterium]
MAEDAKQKLDEVQRAVAATVRALSHEPTLDVGFRGNERRRSNSAAAPAANAVRLIPPRPDLAPQELARVRGEADGAALKVRHHDDALHRRFAPSGEVAALLYDSFERLRIEALGSRDMAGVRANLESAHRARAAAPQPGERGQDATMAEIVELFAREKLMGYGLSEPQRQLLAGWREWLDQRVAEELPPLADSVADQELFARKVREMLAHLGLSEQLAEPPDSSEEQDPSADASEPPQGESQEADGAGEADRGQEQRRAESEPGSSEAADA